MARQQNTIYGLILLLCGSQASMAAGSFKLSTGPFYSSGNYGNSQSTDILYVPLNFNYRQGLLSLGLTLPYIRITGPKNVLRGIGRVGAATTTRGTESGLGDILASARYHVYYNPETGVLLDLTAKVKFGTADSDRALGTGRNDYTLQGNLYKTINNWTPYARLGYKVLGRSSRYHLRNVVYGSLGLSYKLAPETDVGGSFYVAQKSSRTGSNKQQLTLFASHTLDKSWKLQTYAIKGFTDGTPDYAGGASLIYSFK